MSADIKTQVDMIEDQRVQKSRVDNPSNIDPVVQKSLLRKLDYRMIPILFMMYFLNYWDLNGLPQPKLNDIHKDLKLEGTQYNTCISILYVGYLIAGIPSNMILTRVRPSIYLGVCMCGWAVVSGCTALAKNYTQLVMLRFLLGWLEAPFYPGASYLLGRFYTKKEVATRLAILYCGQLCSSSISGLFQWQSSLTWIEETDYSDGNGLFIIEGCTTFGCSILAIFILPDMPGKTSWLTDAENECSVTRLREDSVSQLEHETPIQGCISAIKDYKVWLFMLMQNMHFSAMSFNQFFPTIVETLGYNTTVTLALTCPPYIFAALFSLALAYSTGYFNDRTWHIVGGNALGVVGFILACTTSTTASRYTACFIFAANSYSTGSIILAWASTNVVESHEKKAVTLALVNFCAVLANVYTAYLWPDSDGPQFTVGLASSAGFSALDALVAILACLVFRFLNTRRLRAANDDAAVLFAL